MSHAPLPAAAPFWLSVALIPLVALAAWGGGMWWLIVPVYAWYLTTVLDRVLGLNEANPDPDTATDQLFWHRAVTTHAVNLNMKGVGRGHHGAIAQTNFSEGL